MGPGPRPLRMPTAVRTLVPLLLPLLAACEAAEVSPIRAGGPALPPELAATLRGGPGAGWRPVELNGDERPEWLAWWGCGSAGGCRTTVYAEVEAGRVVALLREAAGTDRPLRPDSGPGWRDLTGARREPGRVRRVRYAHDGSGYRLVIAETELAGRLVLRRAAPLWRPPSVELRALAAQPGGIALWGPHYACSGTRCPEPVLLLTGAGLRGRCPVLEADGAAAPVACETGRIEVVLRPSAAQWEALGRSRTARLRFAGRTVTLRDADLAGEYGRAAREMGESERVRPPAATRPGGAAARRPSAATRPPRRRARRAPARPRRSR